MSTTFTPGQRVTRTFDGKAGTVESVQPYGDTVAIAVRLDSDGEVWSGTAQAWEHAETSTTTYKTTTLNGTEYDTALISLDEEPVVMAVFPTEHRWNGWICPRMDALSVVDVLDTLNAFYGDDGIDGYDYDWREDGALVLTDRQYRDEYGEDFQPEILHPDEDGLYALGAHAWVWSYWQGEPVR